MSPSRTVSYSSANCHYWPSRNTAEYCCTPHSGSSDRRVRHPKRSKSTMTIIARIVSHVHVREKKIGEAGWSGKRNGEACLQTLAEEKLPVMYWTVTNKPFANQQNLAGCSYRHCDISTTVMPICHESRSSQTLDHPRVENLSGH